MGLRCLSPPGRHFAKRARCTADRVCGSGSCVQLGSSISILSAQTLVAINESNAHAALVGQFTSFALMS